MAGEPTIDLAKTFVDEFFYDLVDGLTNLIKSKSSNHSIIDLTAGVLTKNTHFKRIGSNGRIDYDFIRFQYLLSGFLIGKFPNKDYTEIYPSGAKGYGVGIDPDTYYLLTSPQLPILHDQLTDLIFNIYVEDF